MGNTIDDLGHVFGKAPELLRACNSRRFENPGNSSVFPGGIILKRGIKCALVQQLASQSEY